MVIKSKNYKKNVILKLLATAICLVGMLAIVYGLLQNPHFNFSQDAQLYKNSTENANDLMRVYGQAYATGFEYKNVEWVKAGNSITPDRLANKKDELIANENNKISDLHNQYSSWINNAKESKNTDEVTRLTLEKQKRIAEITSAYGKLESEARQNLIEEDLQTYQSQLKDLNASGFDYLVSFQDGTYFTNKPALAGHSLEAASAVYSSFIYGNSEKVVSNNPESFHLDLPPNGCGLLIGIPSQLLDAKTKAYVLNNERSKQGFYTLLAGVLLFFLSTIYLIVTAGHSGQSDGIVLNTLDRIYLDVGLMLTVLGVGGCIALLVYVTDHTYLNSILPATYWCAILIISTGTLLGLNWVLSASKRLKRREFMQHTLLYQASSKVFSFFQQSIYKTTYLLHRGPAMQKAFRQLLFYISASFACVLIGIVFIRVFSIGGLLMGILLLGFLNYVAFIKLVKKYEAFDELVKGTKLIQSGHLQHRISVESEFGFGELADNINNIASGLKHSVDAQVRSERMKAELVTNVSHDLKTPLTSIITYVDLLKSEGLDSEHAPGYLDILDQKSQRLKTLTEDLFEAAKASSGNIPVTLAAVDLTELLTQGLGELSDQIEQSGLDFKFNLPSERLTVTADGKLLWRVMENLLSNVFKYALPGSRVYLEILKTNTHLCISLKNISHHALNIPAEELMERFKRGDISRNSEGSGLGLSIARSLTEIQNGQFDVTIDGDLFKVSLCFELHPTSVVL